jgi:Predicted metal-dependent hydrolase
MEVSEMSAETTKNLIKQLQGARIVDLAQTLHSNMPQLPGAPRFHLSLLRRHGDAMRGEGYSAANSILFTIDHAGTHLDAIGHVSVNGRLFGDLPADEIQAGTQGLKQLGIETVEPMVRRGVLLDIAGLLGGDALPPAFAITGELLQACLAATGTRIEVGDVVLVRTGWGQFWGDPERYVSREAGLPGVDRDGAAWLSARGIFAAGADCLMFERFHPSDDRLPVHCELIQGAGIHLLENLNLEALAGEHATEFAVVVLPLKLVGATAAQVRPIAIL